MATRKNLSHDARTREKIKTSQLVNRLQSFANGEIELNRDQIRAIEVLLKKTLPDLTSVDLSASVTGEVVAKVVFKGLNGDG